MNNSQLVTLAEARKIAKKLGTIGGGVLPYNSKDSEKSGIYIIEFGGPFATPEQDDRKFYHFRFRNGAKGFNAGLVKQIMEFSPMGWQLMISNEVNTEARS